MAAGINERIWLEWLVKVRIIIITILLAIELAIVNLTTTKVDRRLWPGDCLSHPAGPRCAHQRPLRTWQGNGIYIAFPPADF